ncbi:hypothetical protein BD626DRAFT_498705 [Schizophyllum amplum]|uniref:SET domain-containing protein n=1 Tax=Schizophyllum amplum TaxID=97359 RepID=A0A550CBV0_9AGAR|nr:hypothetical protein BD626DRAFT_498705 [Auriculariopsis ampla]
MLNTSGLRAPDDNAGPSGLPLHYSLDNPNLGTPELITKVLKGVWKEFSEWKEEQARSLLRALRPPAKPTLHPVKPVPRALLPSTRISTTERHEFLVLDYSDDTTSSHEPWALHSEPVIVAPRAFDTLSSYESFTPTDRSVYVGDDSGDMPYVRYIDDPTFDATEDLDWYHNFAWMHLRDPDLELLVIEAARRLHVDHGLSYEHLQETGIFPFPLLAKGPTPGLLEENIKRDLTPFPRVGLDHEYPSTDFSTIFETLVITFCPFINCITPNCSVHSHPENLPLRVAPYAADAPPRTACGPACHQLFVAAEPVSWEPDVYNLLRTVLEVSPDAEPCDLAVVCLKPCNEVAQLASVIIKKLPAHKVPLPSRAAATPEFQDHILSSFVPNTPCRHTGHCTAANKCPCAYNGAHCSRVCRCPPKCERRWRGCNCTPDEDGLACCVSRSGNGKPNSRRNQACPCRQAARECDPDVCTGCASRDHTLGCCQNSQIQHGARKKTVLQKSQWGTGVFAAERMVPGDLICEYVGELIHPETTQSRSVLTIHRRCNYLFDLNPEFAVDAVHAGNESRFINHCEHDNVAAHIKLVNGEPRLGIYANRAIKPGDELLIDYGPDFAFYGAGNDTKDNGAGQESWMSSFTDPADDDTQDWTPSK